ncbi:MAG: methyltransferase [candidate division KSB1 bacterium]|nr:methyltransferase [candidate division KSB1 bacterium]MDZ7413561.1 methyltransferase [candidate division KSB1 bacterium]
MTSRERVRAALAHREPDKVPIDFGGTGVTGMHVTCVAALRDYYGLERRPVKVHEPYQMLGWIDQDLQDVLGIDVNGLYARTTMFGFPNENWREFRLPWGQVVLVSEHFRTTVDANGDLLIYPEGDTTAPPSGRMPVAGFFFDTIVRQPPIEEERLDPADNTEEFKPLNDQDLAHYRAEVERLADSPRAIVASFGGTAFGDIALVPAPFLKYPKGIRDIAEWYISTVTRQEYLHRVYAKQTEVALANLEKIHSIVGDLVDVVFVCGTDFGTQTSTFCSVETFRSLYAPYYRKVNDWIHRHTCWKTFKHSCGAVEPFMGAFIEVGFDVINPVQCSAAGMDPRRLKDTYGDQLVFWGGGVDTQKTLPFGTPAQVREEVLRRCEIFARNGGFVFNAVHNVQANTPVENLVAMFDAVKEFNGET